ncbi:hypothetical protein WJX72_005704 [[Myrmecia] bisecta]|uniref:BZIP domain-containing protein n=1 Tax=[Myrmecia] bisecta TaxID=41462 RepID=A0AAW1PSX5_9CHLO
MITNGLTPDEVRKVQPLLAHHLNILQAQTVSPRCKKRLASARDAQLAEASKRPQAEKHSVRDRSGRFMPRSALQRSQSTAADQTSLLDFGDSNDAWDTHSTRSMLGDPHMGPEPLFPSASNGQTLSAAPQTIMRMSSELSDSSGLTQFDSLDAEYDAFVTASAPEEEVPAHMANDPKAVKRFKNRQAANRARAKRLDIVARLAAEVQNLCEVNAALMSKLRQISNKALAAQKENEALRVELARAAIRGQLADPNADVKGLTGGLASLIGKARMAGLSEDKTEPCSSGQAAASTSGPAVRAEAATAAAPAHGSFPRTTLNSVKPPGRQSQGRPGPMIKVPTRKRGSNAGRSYDQRMAAQHAMQHGAAQQLQQPYSAGRHALPVPLPRVDPALLANLAKPSPARPAARAFLTAQHLDMRMDPLMPRRPMALSHAAGNPNPSPLDDTIDLDLDAPDLGDLDLFMDTSCPMRMDDDLAESFAEALEMYLNEH